jgi:hypothetical protein
MRDRRNQGDPSSRMRSLVLRISVMILAFGCAPAEEASLSPDSPSSPRVADPALRPEPSIGRIATGGPTSPQVADIAREYQQLQSMTKEPVYVDPGLARFCRGVTQSEVEEARKRSGPHAHTAVRIYMNDLAANAFRRRSTAYPVGSVIAKEKAALSYHSEGREQAMTKAHDGVGGMIKRPPGFDPAHGDWEYFYFEDPSKIESGKISSCVQCHDGASARDHVFGGWAERG